MMKSVFICYPNENYRLSLTQFLSTEAKQIKVLGGCASYDYCVEYLRGNSPDFLLIAFPISDKEDVQKVRQLKSSFPEIEVVVLSFDFTGGLAERFEYAGAIKHLNI